MKKIRTGDQVVVITGRDKGKKGTVSAMLGDKILVDGVNQYKKKCQTKSSNWCYWWCD